MGKKNTYKQAVESLEVPKDRTAIYERTGTKISRKHIKDKKVKAAVQKYEKQLESAAKAAARTEMLLQEEGGFLEPETEMERTFKFTQDDLKASVDVSSAKKRFDLNLDFGPYAIDYTRNGRELLIGGRKGHIASFDWREAQPKAELFVNETVHDVQWLHNNQYFAAAQKKYTFIYDFEGTELHRLKQHIEATRLTFLPYHMLLVSAGNTGFIKYHDVSTGALVAELRTKLGPTLALKQNPWNAVVHAGHSNGTVTLWAPNMSTPLVKLLSNRGPVRDIAIDREGKYMATAGMDKSIRIWDIRTFKPVETYHSPTPACSLDISDNGLLAVGWGPHVSIWKDVLRPSGGSSGPPKPTMPYMTHLLPGNPVDCVRFCPFEDVLGIGSKAGFSSLLVPGAGEANFDSYEANPYETAKQRQQNEVRGLLNKLSPEMISLDPNYIGEVNAQAPAERTRHAYLNPAPKKEVKTEIRPEVKGRNSALRRHLRKRTKNVIDQRKMRLEANLEREKELRQKRAKELKGETVSEHPLATVFERFKQS